VTGGVMEFVKRIGKEFKSRVMDLTDVEAAMTVLAVVVLFTVAVIW
jgi:hypothetical protein